MREFIPVLAVFALAELSAFGQWTVFDMDNSPLPSVTVSALEGDGSGGIWVGTDWGLCHFDATEQWQVFQQGVSGLPGNGITALELASTDELWVATSDAGLATFDGASSWNVYTALNSDLPEDGIRDVHVDSDGGIWATTSGGLAYRSGANWVVYDNTPESHNGAVLNTGNTMCVARRADGLICLGTLNGGLHFIDGSNVEVLTSFEDGFFDNSSVEVLFDPLTGERWVATPAAGLLRQQGPAIGGLWTQWNTAIGFPSNAMTCMTIDPSRRIWVGTQTMGIVRVGLDGNFTQFTTSNSGLPDNEVRSIHATDDGSIWVGTSTGGLARFQEWVGIDEHAQDEVRVFPNPASGNVSVSGVADGRSTPWQLVSLTGQLLDAGVSTGPWQFDVGLYAPGAYFLRIDQDGLVGSIRLFVDR